MNIRTIILLILAIPKTIIFNFRYFKFREAMKFPILVSHNVILKKLGGNIKIEGAVKPAMIKIGFFEPAFFYKQGLKCIWNVYGTVVFKGSAVLGIGTKITAYGQIIFGENTRITANTDIDCKERIVFGDDVLIGWDCLFMDSDNHKIYDRDRTLINENKEIIIGNKCWIGAKCTILKGAAIGENVILAGNSCLLGKIENNNCVIGGYPAKYLKAISEWER
ncbi:acyltransferase [Bacillus sp. PK3-056]|uniref:acyltransferase n=1 Tax=Niallia circulans TaxID=1397 RepID=UPI000F45C312|nr:acyltransferase [Niallia circulans]AYV73362.1 galactoside O-acetyltransferase [Niallia circulans]